MCFFPAPKQFWLLFVIQQPTILKCHAKTLFAALLNGICKELLRQCVSHALVFRSKPHVCVKGFCRHERAIVGRERDNVVVPFWDRAPTRNSDSKTCLSESIIVREWHRTSANVGEYSVT